MLHQFVLGASKAVEDFEAVTSTHVTDCFSCDTLSDIVLISRDACPLPLLAIVVKIDKVSRIWPHR